MRNAICLVACVWVSACGGSDSTTDAAPVSPVVPGTVPPAAAPGPVPGPAPNSPPVIQKLPPELHALTGHAFSYDLSMGGTTATDPDNDPLTYAVSVYFCSSTVIQLAEGLSLNGTLLSGVPAQSGYCDLRVAVDDNKPASTTAYYMVRLWIAVNSAPVVSRPNRPLLVNDGGHIDYDVTQGGTTFLEPDGDAMTYGITLRGNTQGLVVSGRSVVGNLPEVGAVDVVVTARDDYGGQASHSFLIARPATISAAPVLPATPPAFRDEELALPFIFRISSESEIPLFDTQPEDNRTTNAGAELGRVLFYDKRLSLTNSVSCSSCHEQERGFASPRRFDVGITGVPMKRNSMALANARYNIASAWFWDMRSEGTQQRNSLQNVVLHPLQDHDELGMDPDLLVSKLTGTPFYPELFAKAFGTREITIDRISRALAQFVQALISYRSKADRAVNTMNNEQPDPASVFDSRELRGLEIFQSNCSICHEPHAHANVWQANNGLDAVPVDPGTLVPALRRGGFRGVFRSSSLRNVAVSAPYMHDGRFGTLREVIEHYNSGVQASPDTDGILLKFDGSAITLDLSDADKDALEAYLLSLTDEAFLTDSKFSDPFP